MNTVFNEVNKESFARIEEYQFAGGNNITRDEKTRRGDDNDKIKVNDNYKIKERNKEGTKNERSLLTHELIENHFDDDYETRTPLAASSSSSSSSSSSTTTTSSPFFSAAAAAATATAIDSPTSHKPAVSAISKESTTRSKAEVESEVERGGGEPATATLSTSSETLSQSAEISKDIEAALESEVRD